MPPVRDYYPAIADAVSKLDSNTAETRQALFERAKSLVVQELRARRPPAKEPEIVRECAALRAAIRKVEAELAVNVNSLAKARNSFGPAAKGVLGFAAGFIFVFGLEALLFGGMEFLSGRRLGPAGLGWIVMPFVAGCGGWKLFRELDFAATIGAKRAFGKLRTWPRERKAELALVISVGWIAGVLLGFIVALPQFLWAFLACGFAGGIISVAAIYAHQFLPVETASLAGRADKE